MASRLGPGWRRAVCALTLALCASCAPAESVRSVDQSASGNTVQLTLAAFPNHGLGPLIAQWTADHPGVEVEIVERPYNEHHDWFFEQAEAGERTADIASIEVAVSHRAGAHPEYFLDLNDFGVADIEDHYLDWRWDHGVGADGSVIGLPTDIGGLAMAYRTDLFEEAGLPTDREEVAALWPTWEALIDVGSRYRERTGAAFIDDAGSLFHARMNQVTTDRFYDADGNQTIATSTGVLDSWRYAIDVADAGIAANVPAFGSEWTAALQASRADAPFAVLLAPAWMMTTIKLTAPDTYGLWDITTLPNDELGGNWGGSQLVIPADARHPEIAFDLIRFLLGINGQREVFKQFGNLPSIPALYDEPSIADLTDPFFNDAPVGRIFTDSAKRMRAAKRGPFEREILQVFRDELTEYDEANKPSAADALDAYERAVEQAVDLHG